MCSVYVMGERCPLGFLGTDALYRPSSAATGATGLGAPNASGVTKCPCDHTLDALASNASPTPSLARASPPRVDTTITEARTTTTAPTTEANTLVVAPRRDDTARASDADADADAKSASSSLDMSTRDDDRRRTPARLSRHSFIHSFIRSRLQVAIVDNASLDRARRPTSSCARER
jgi:hypothetical protein